MALAFNPASLQYAESRLGSIADPKRLVNAGSLLQFALHVAQAPTRMEFGALCQLVTILREAPKAARLHEIQVALRRLVESKLSYHDSAVQAAFQIEKLNLPELAKYKTSGLTYGYVLKNVNIEALAALAATQSSGLVASLALMTQCQHTSWSPFANDWGFDARLYLTAVEPILDGMLVTYGVGDIEHGCSLYPQGPYPCGYPLSVTTVPAASQAPATPYINPVSSTHVSSTVTTGAITMNATTTNTTVANLSSLNAAYKPIIDGMFSQSGLSITVDQLIAEVSAKGTAERNLAETEKLLSQHKDMAKDIIDDLKRKLASASAAPAMPSTISIVAHSTTLPSGAMTMTDAASLFPLMSGLKLKVPSFTWDHAHPDVPAINPAYIFRKEMLMKALRCLSVGENMWLSGHTGSGKTTFIEQVAARLGWPVARVAFDSNVDRSELVGRMSLSGDGKGGTTSSWLPGILETAMTNGYILLCDEMDAGHPNALYTLQPLLEGKGFTLLEDGGRIVSLSPMFRMAATGNTTGNGDPSCLYPACRILSAATLDRFSTFVNVPYMTTDEEVALISNHSPTLTKKLVLSLAKFAGEMRNAFVSGETPISYSPRRSMSFAREVESMFDMGFTDQQEVLSAAFKSKLYDAASEEFRQRITEIANSTLGGIDPTKGIQ